MRNNEHQVMRPSSPYAVIVNCHCSLSLYLMAYCYNPNRDLDDMHDLNLA